MLTSPNSGIINDPFRNIIDGMIQGAQLHSQMQRAQDEHMAMQRAAVETDRNNRIQDITQKMLLQGNSRPVNPDGTVTEDGQPLTATLPGGGTSSAPVSYTRKADKGRLVTYKDQDGNAMQRELLTRDEQIAKQTQEKATLARAGQVDVSGIMRSMIPQQAQGEDTETPYGSAPSLMPAGTGASPVPDSVYVNPAQVPGILGDMVRDQNSRRTSQSRSDVADTNADARKYAADKSAEARTAPKLTKTYTDNKNNMVGAYSDGTTKILGPALVKPSAGRGATGSPDRQKAITDRVTTQGLAKAELTKGAALAKGEKDYATATNRIGLTPASKMDDAARATAASGAQGALQTAKQNAQDAYEATRKQLGMPTDHVAYPPVGPGRGAATGTQPPPQQAAAPQTAAPRPRAVDGKGNAVEWNGKAWIPVPKQ